MGVEKGNAGEEVAFKVGATESVVVEGTAIFADAAVGTGVRALVCSSTIFPCTGWAFRTLGARAVSAFSVGMVKGAGILVDMGVTACVAITEGGLARVGVTLGKVGGEVRIVGGDGKSDDAEVP